MWRKAVLQNRMALDIFSRSQGGNSSIIQTKCYVFIPDESSNITHLMTHRKNYIAALDDPLPSLGDLLGRWFGHGRAWLKILLVILTTLLAVVICLFYKAKHLEKPDRVYNSGIIAIV